MGFIRDKLDEYKQQRAEEKVLRKAERKEYVRASVDERLRTAKEKARYDANEKLRKYKERKKHGLFGPQKPLPKGNKGKKGRRKEYGSSQGSLDIFGRSMFGSGGGFDMDDIDVLGVNKKKGRKGGGGFDLGL